jgi:hypothetical protein
VLALAVGAGSGLGAVGFRYLINFFTWLATGHDEFGQQGYAGSAHLPWLGLAFLVVTPVIGGLLYGPLIYNWAREARGHGVPEVMIVVADEGGRIRPQVSVVKAVASALCTGTGGSVGREGPIVQIGSALASGLGQWVKMPESRMRILVGAGDPGPVRGGGDGRGVRLSGPRAADLAGVRGGDDGRLRSDPAGHAGPRHRHRDLPGGQLRHHLHHQAAAPRHRHRPHHAVARPVRPQGRRRHAALPLRHCCAAPSRRQRARHRSTGLAGAGRP